MSFTLLGILNSQAAGGGALPAYDLLQTIEPTTNPASITFSGLGSYTDYKHLQIRAEMQGSRDDNLDIRFNGDSSSSYWIHYIRGTSGALNAYGNGAYNKIEFGEAFADDFTGVEYDNYAPMILDIADFSSTNKRTTIRAIHGQVNPDRAELKLSSGVWRNNAAVTSIYLGLNGGTITSNSRFSLYGIKG